MQDQNDTPMSLAEDLQSWTVLYEQSSGTVASTSNYVHLETLNQYTCKLDECNAHLFAEMSVC